MNRVVLPLCLVLDDISRAKLNVGRSLNDLVQYDVKIIRSLRDITNELSSRRFVILEDYLRRSNCYSDLELYKAVFGLSYVFIGQDKVLLNSMKDLADCYCMDSTTLNYEQLYSVVYDDKAMRAKYEVTPKNSEVSKYSKQVLDDPDSTDQMKSLAGAFLALEDLIEQGNLHKESLKVSLTALTSELQNLSSKNAMLSSHYLGLIGNAVQLNRSLQQYEVILSKDVYDKIDVSRYDTRPHILYLKEYEELQDLELLLETLVNMFKFQHKMSAKVITLLDSTHTKRIMTLPQGYAKLYNKYPKRLLLEQEFLVKVGAYKEILENLFINETNLDVLIIVDCKSHLDTVLSGPHLMLPMCRRSTSLEAFGLDPRTTIVNGDPSSRLSWGNYPQLKSLGTQEERFLFLSSRPLIQDIYRSCTSFVR